MGDAEHLVRGWLLDFLRRHGPGEIALSPIGSVLGVAYASLDILIETDSADTAYIHTSLMPIPATDQLALFEHLLHLNALCIATGGSTLALDRHDQHVLLCHNFRLSALDEDLFSSKLLDFVAHADRLKRSLRSLELSTWTPSSLPIGIRA